MRGGAPHTRKPALHATFTSPSAVTAALETRNGVSSSRCCDVGMDRSSDTVCGACTSMLLADASIGARRTVRCGERHAGALARARMLAAMHVHDPFIAMACAVDVS